MKKPSLPLHFFVGAFEKDSYQWNSDGPHPLGGGGGGGSDYKWNVPLHCRGHGFKSRWSRPNFSGFLNQRQLLKLSRYVRGAFLSFFSLISVKLTVCRLPYKIISLISSVLFKDNSKAVCVCVSVCVCHFGFLQPTCTTYPVIHLKFSGCFCPLTRTTPDRCFRSFRPAKMSRSLK